MQKQGADDRSRGVYYIATRSCRRTSANVVHRTEHPPQTRGRPLCCYLLPLSLLPLLPPLLVLLRPRPLTSSSDGLRLLPAVSTRFLGGDLSSLRRAGERLRLRDRERERESEEEDLERLSDEESEPLELLLSDPELDPASDPELELEDTDLDRFLFFLRSFSLASKILSAIPEFDLNSLGMSVIGGWILANNSGFSRSCVLLGLLMYGRLNWH